jgi:aldose 1-epimerase
MKSPIVFQNQPAWEIGAGDGRVIVAPEHGARILRWEQAGREIIRWPAEADWTRILKVRGGNPILFPFVARHFVDGQPEVWRDEAGTIRRMPQHGFARDAKFTVVEEGPENSLRMRLTDTEETRVFYPFSFRFDVVVALEAPGQLRVDFETTNTGREPMPYYAGHHFYFAVPHQERIQWQLHLPCAEWGRQNPDGSIRREKAAQSDFCLDDPALVDRMQVGPAATGIKMSNGPRRLEFDLRSSTPWYAATTWTEADTSDFYCLEPWLGLPNAIHHGQGLRRLNSGQNEKATCILKVTNW